ncbi:MAG: histone deacetylase [Chloroflexi bacterium]|nr:histone deacetylase [Chloroflexota bacterium]
MQFFYCDHHTFPLPASHRFPLLKYAKLRERIQRELPQASLHTTHAASEEQILRVHDHDYLQKLKEGTISEKEGRRLGLPWTPQLLTRSLYSVGGTIAAAHAAVEDRIAMNLAGGTHHAYPDHGEGFCVFNDVAIAIRALQDEGVVERVVIIDCDVHQGNGTAFIFQDDANVFTFSIHGAKNFPLHKEKSDLDIELADGTGDDDYLSELDWGVRRALDLSQAQLAFYLAGSDPFEGDTLGRLKLSKAGLAARDRLVLDHCRAAGIPVAITMSGGYARNIEDSVDIHFNTAKVASEQSDFAHRPDGSC